MSKIFQLKLLFLWIGAAILITHCKKNDCGLHEFKNVKYRKFSPDKWNGSNLNNKNDTIEIYYNTLKQREEMLCDLTQNHLKVGEKNENIIRSLGSTSKININHYTWIYNNLDTTIINSPRYHKLIYEAGFNASGSCFIVLFLDEHENYINCLRAVSR